MTDHPDRVADFVDQILKDRRPRRFRATPDDLALMRTAIHLRAARMGACLPDPRFVDRLGRRLRSELGEAPRPAIRGDGHLRWLTRRGALGRGLTVAGAALAGALAVQAVPAARPPLVSDDMVPNHGAWQPVLALSELPPGRAARFSSRHLEGIVVNDGGRVRALSATCTHLGCLLTVNPAAPRLDCPCHDLSFTWTGRVLRYRLPHEPATLPILRSRVRAGRIEVLLPVG